MANRQDFHSLRHSSEEEKSVQEIVTHTGNGNTIVQLAEDYINNRATLHLYYAVEERFSIGSK